MTEVTDKFGDWIKEGFNIYKDNLGLLIVASLIASLLSGVTFGILSGPMFAGLVLIVLKLRDGSQPPPVAGDVFQGFQHFLPSFLFCIVWGAIILVGTVILSFIPCLGQILTICLWLAAGALLMFGLFLIVDKKMDFWSASMASIEKVKTAFFPFLGLAVVAGIIGGIGAIVCGIGVIVTMPICFTILVVTYRDVFSSDAAPTQGSGTETQGLPETPAEPPSPGAPE